MPVHLRLAALTTILFGFGANPASADSVLAHLQAISKSCSQDVQSLCGDLAPGGGRAIKCLGANIMKVSMPCRDTMLTAMNELCGQDLARLCPGVSASGPSAEACLHSHITELKGSCKVAAARVESTK